MGNCMILREKSEIKIMRMDGKILSYQSPLKVYQALLDFPGYAISNELTVNQHLDPKADMLSGQLYYLIPPEKPVLESRHGTGFVRIKLVLSKQELKDMLEKGGILGEDVISQLRREPSKIDVRDKEGCMGWKPTLESIPEGNDFF